LDLTRSNKMFVISEMKTGDVLIGNPYLLLMLEHLGIDMEIHEKSVEKIYIENIVSNNLYFTN
jgi:hypothetical protein